MRIALQQKKVGKKFAGPEQHVPFSHGAGCFRLVTVTSGAKKSKLMVSTTTVVRTQAGVPDDVNNISRICDIKRAP